MDNMLLTRNFRFCTDANRRFHRLAAMQHRMRVCETKMAGSAPPCSMFFAPLRRGRSAASAQIRARRRAFWSTARAAVFFNDHPRATPRASSAGPP